MTSPSPAAVTRRYDTHEDIQLMRFADYFGRAFAKVSSSQFLWMKILRESSVEKMVDHSCWILYCTNELQSDPKRWFSKYLQNLRGFIMNKSEYKDDVISLHPILDKTMYHLVNKEQLAIIKKGTWIDEVALVEHLRENPMFRVGLDVFEDEPYMKPGNADMKKAVMAPHIASASKGKLKAAQCGVVQTAWMHS